MVHRCEGRFVGLQVDAQNLVGVVNRRSPKLIINELARELFWFCPRNRITIFVEWVPNEENVFADDISKMYILEDSMLSRRFFGLLDGRWVPHTVDLFSSGANNHCARFYAMHWCRGDAGINAFRHLCTRENCSINCPYNLIGKVWRTLREQKGLATMLIPMVADGVPGHQPLI